MIPMEWSWREGIDQVVIARGPGWGAPCRFADLAEAEHFVRLAIVMPDGRQALLRALGPARPDLGGPALGLPGDGTAEAVLAAALARRLHRGEVLAWRIDEARTLPLPIGTEDSEPPPTSARGSPAHEPSSPPGNEAERGWR